MLLYKKVDLMIYIFIPIRQMYDFGNGRSKFNNEEIHKNLFKLKKLLISYIYEKDFA